MSDQITYVSFKLLREKNDGQKVGPNFQKSQKVNNQQDDFYWKSDYNILN
jgi:hypothetical protein